MTPTINIPLINVPCNTYIPCFSRYCRVSREEAVLKYLLRPPAMSGRVGKEIGCWAPALPPPKDLFNQIFSLAQHCVRRQFN